MISAPGRAAASPEDPELLRKAELREIRGCPPGGSGSWFHAHRTH